MSYDCLHQCLFTINADMDKFLGTCKVLFLLQCLTESGIYAYSISSSSLGNVSLTPSDRTAHSQAEKRSFKKNAVQLSRPATSSEGEVGIAAPPEALPQPSPHQQAEAMSDGGTTSQKYVSKFQSLREQHREKLHRSGNHSDNNDDKDDDNNDDYDDDYNDNNDNDSANKYNDGNDNVDKVNERPRSLAAELKQINNLLQTVNKEVPQHVRGNEEYYLNLTKPGRIIHKDSKVPAVHIHQHHIKARSTDSEKADQMSAEEPVYDPGNQILGTNQQLDSQTDTQTYPLPDQLKKDRRRVKKKPFLRGKNLSHKKLRAFNTDSNELEEDFLDQLASGEVSTFSQEEQTENSKAFENEPPDQHYLSTIPESNLEHSPQMRDVKLHTNPPQTDDDSLSKISTRPPTLKTKKSRRRQYLPPVNTTGHSSRNKRQHGNNTRVRRFKQTGFKLSRQEVMELFQEYYACVEKMIKSWTSENEFNIHVKLATEGQEVKMECIICQRPDEDPDQKLVGWQYLRKSDTALMAVQETDNIKISKDFTLTIKSVDIEDAGQYFCVEDGDYAAIFLVDVLLRERRKRVLANETEKLHKPEDLADRNLHLFTTWTEWTECNKCNKPGQRQKVGLCMVKKMEQGKPITPNDYPVVELYKDGLPCHSTALPKGLAKLEEIRFRPSETLLGPCEVPCPTTPAPIVITDENGEVVEIISAGFFPLRKKPTLPSMIQRKVMFEDQGTHVVLKCPHATNEDLIRWQRGTRTINPVTIKRQTRGRVWIDKKQEFHIKKLMLADNDAYHCYAKDNLVATFKLIAVEAISNDLKTYISFAGIVLTGLVVLILVCKITCKRRQLTAK